MSDIKKLTRAILDFQHERDWKQFHDPKDMVFALIEEAVETGEHFKWKKGKELETYIKAHKKEIGDELSDVLYWLLTLSHDLNIDLYKASVRKLEENRKKYPVDKSKGNNKKYTKL